jgi:hypothetical protein
MLQGYNETRSLALRWPFCIYKSLVHILNDLFNTFFRLSFPYWLWRRVIPYTKFLLRAHGRCDRSAEDAYFSAAPYPTFAFDFDFSFLLWLRFTHS